MIRAYGLAPGGVYPNVVVKLIRSSPHSEGARSSQAGFGQRSSEQVKLESSSYCGIHRACAVKRP
jgi:hypothetical protein